MVNLVALWLKKDFGGLGKIHEQNKRKANMLYDVIDGSNGFFVGHAQPDSRSIMNVTFRLPNEDLQAGFLAAAQQRDLCNLKGHRSVGGIRASIYNSMPVAGVERLRDFMREFAKENL
jgi:phosphoserine aminotransferase